MNIHRTFLKEMLSVVYRIDIRYARIARFKRFDSLSDLVFDYVIIIR